MHIKQTSEVFGVSNTILPDSYVDRDNLDDEIIRLLSRKTHIVLRGESRCGKSWLRQKDIPNALVVQCRLRKTILDLYADALSQLQIQIISETNEASKVTGEVQASGEIGVKLLAKLGIHTCVGSEACEQRKSTPVGKDIHDLKFIADVINASGRKLVVEDFHYLSIEERKKFAFDLKTLWDYGCFVVIIGVWPQNNVLLYFNPDLATRVYEKSIYWSDNDLDRVIDQGCDALNISVSNDIRKKLIKDSFGNVGLVQQLMLLLLDNAKIYQEQRSRVVVSDMELYIMTAQMQAVQLNTIYNQFAKRVSKGIYNRNAEKSGTAIYAHAMKVIVESSDEKLFSGLSAKEIFDIAVARQPRIQFQNLKAILKKLEELQVDEDGRGLIIAYDESDETISIVDRQLLFYRQYLSMTWPWDDIIAELDTSAPKSDYHQLSIEEVQI